jgi:hypothetical protein
MPPVVFVEAAVQVMWKTAVTLAMKELFAAVGVWRMLAACGNHHSSVALSVAGRTFSVFFTYGETLESLLYVC